MVRVFHDQNNTEYDEGNENDPSIKFETKVIKSSLCDYLDAYIVTGYITATGGNANIKVQSINKYNLIEYKDNYSDKSGSLWQFKRDKSHIDDNGNPADVATDIHYHLNTNQVF